MTEASNITNKQGERLDISFHRGDKLESIVVLGHGVTGDKDRPLLLAVAEGLSKRGWPCIRVSFSGNGDSEGRFEDSTISKEVDDLRAVLKTVPQEKRIAYIGHSMGGAVGVLTASSGLHIQSLITLAGMTHTAEFVSREFGEVKPGEGCMWDEEDCNDIVGMKDEACNFNMMKSLRAFGRGKVSELGETAASFGKRALLVTAPPTPASAMS